MIYTEDKIIELINKSKKHKTETYNIEFKDARGGMPKIWRTISSFAHNPEGGVIIFGLIEDKNTRDLIKADLEDIALLQEQIASYFSEVMINAPRPDIRVITYEGFPLIAIIINEIPTEEKPCYKKDLGIPNGACVRVGNTDRTITPDEMKQFIRNSSPFKFDKSQAEGTNISMLSQRKIKSFLEKSAKRTGRSFDNDSDIEQNILKNLGIINKFHDTAFPTIGGFLIFSEEKPQAVVDFSRYIVRCVRYSGVTVSSPIVDKADIDGPLDEQIDLILKFILRNIPVSASISGSKRVEKYEYPEEAIRELVANAIIHRDYRLTETYSQVNIFSNRVEISNPGTLPPGITIENIQESQFSRNEIIAGILRDMDYLEEYGRGINIVFSRMAEEGLLEPIFKNVANSFKVILLGKIFKDLNERQVKIWNLIREKGKITAKECVAILGKKVSRGTTTTDIKKLIENGLIKPLGSSYNTYYTPLH